VTRLTVLIIISLMRRIATDGVAWSVFCVCLYVKGIISAKTAEQIEMPFGSDRPQNQVLHGGHVRERAIFDWANMGMPGRFTKGHGSLGRRCGLLSNYFDLLFLFTSVFPVT